MAAIFKTLSDVTFFVEYEGRYDYDLEITAIHVDHGMGVISDNIYDFLSKNTIDSLNQAVREEEQK